MNSDILDTTNCRDISSELLLPNGKLKALHAHEYEKFSNDDIRLFCHEYGRYGLPTKELILMLRGLIQDRSAIEIGAGHGDLGFHLRIPMTDSKMQQLPDVKIAYALMRQPVIEYPEDVEKLDYLEAIKKYKPQVVIGSWITQYSDKLGEGNIYAVNEEELLKHVEMYIMIGNEKIHGQKIIVRNYLHEKQWHNYLLSRASQDANRIYIWRK